MLMSTGFLGQSHRALPSLLLSKTCAFTSAGYGPDYSSTSIVNHRRQFGGCHPARRHRLSRQHPQVVANNARHFGRGQPMQAAQRFHHDRHIVPRLIVSIPVLIEKHQPSSSARSRPRAVPFGRDQARPTATNIAARLPAERSSRQGPGPLQIINASIFKDKSSLSSAVT